MLKRYLFGGLLLLLATCSLAAVPHWQIIPNESELTFEAQQNDAPVKGQFKQFTGEIAFDPNQLADSYVKIVVDLNSLSASYSELVTTLKSAPWFNISVYPQAIFKANNFKKISDKQYEANGTLTIRNITKPLIIKFDVLKNMNDYVVIRGQALLKRNDYGVGQGEWVSTDEVKNEVHVNFIIAARKTA